jgi:hypothetical protein
MKHRIPFENLTRRKMCNLLQRAVIDGKIKDSTLFMYESGLENFNFTDMELTILKSYYNKKGTLMLVIDKDELETICEREERYRQEEK